MKRIVILLAVTLCCAGCRQKTTVGLDVDLYLHAASTDPLDTILQAAIGKRFSDSPLAKTSIVHVRVEGLTAILTGTAKSTADRGEAERIARETEVSLNGVSIRARDPIINRISIP